MYKRFPKNLLIKFLIFFVVVGLYSCGSTKQLKYFQDLPDSTKISAIKLSNYTTSVIHPGDILGVDIYTIDVNATMSVNIINSAATNPVTGGVNFDYQPAGYTVDPDGNIEVLELGKINVANLTIDQAQNIIRVKAAQYFNEPIVVVKNNAFRITFIGEFQKTGSFIIQRQKFTIIDALGLAGGLTDFGKRDDVLLLRQNNDNTISTIRINLLSSAILKTPYYYLQNNDVLLANPNKSKGISTDQTFNRYLALYSLIGSLLTTIIVLIKH